MTLSRNKQLWTFVESTAGSDPSSSGANYLPWNSLTAIGDLQLGKAKLPTNYFTGRAWGTKPVAGIKSWSFDCESVVWGLSTAAGDAGSPPSNDVLDDILTTIFGTQTAFNGEGCDATGSTTTNVVCDTDVRARGDLLGIYDSGLSSISPNRMQWAYITADAGDGSYTVAPTLDEAISATGVSYGYNLYSPNPDDAETRAFIYKIDGTEMLLLGGKCMSCTMELSEPGGLWMLKTSWAGYDYTIDASHGSLPSFQAVDFRLTDTAIHGVGQPAYFNGAKLSDPASITIDFGINAQHIRSTEGSEGRSGGRLITMAPKVSVVPLFDEANHDLQDGNTAGDLLIPMGRGVLSGSKVNSCCLHIPEATCEAVSLNDDNGVQRNSLEFTASDEISPGSAISSRFVQFARS